MRRRKDLYRERYAKRYKETEKAVQTVGEKETERDRKIEIKTERTRERREREERENERERFTVKDRISYCEVNTERHWCLCNVTSGL